MEPTVPCTEEKMTSPAGEKESVELGTNRVDTMPKSNQSETLPVPPVPTAKVADRPHILTIVLTTMAILVSALSAYVAYSAVKLNLESLILIQKAPPFIRSTLIASLEVAAKLLFSYRSNIRTPPASVFNCKTEVPPYFIFVKIKRRKKGCKAAHP
jgi:hypothetical protein